MQWNFGRREFRAELTQDPLFCWQSPLIYSKYSSPTWTCCSMKALIFLKYAWPGTSFCLDSAIDTKCLSCSVWKKNWSSLWGVMKECIKSAAGPGFPCIRSATSFATHYAFRPTAFSSSLFNSSMERFLTSLFYRLSRASWCFHFKAPPSTIASPIQAFDLSASFCPLSSRALWM